MESSPTSLAAATGWSLQSSDLPLLLLSERGEIVGFSQGAKQLLSGDEETPQGKPIEHFFASERAEDLLSRLPTRPSDGARSLDARFRVGWGAVLPFRVVARRLEAEGQGFFLLTLLDRSLEEQLRKEIARLKGELNLAYQRVDRMALEGVSPDEDSPIEISVLHQISRALLTTIELNKILYIILTCVTAHPAFGFSRAFLLLVDEETQMLEGKMGVGPRSAEEAHRIWQDLSQANWGLEEFLAQYDRLYPDGELPLDSIIRQYRRPLRPEQGILADAVLRQEALQVEDAVSDPRVSPETLAILGCNQFVVVPLVAQNKAVGVVVADNLYKDRGITARDLRLLNLFANHGAMALQNAATYAQLRENINLLQEVQEQLIQAERLSAIGEMTAKVAHEIRNPLVTIGGFARSVLKSLPPESTQARKCEIIVEETLRLEEILGSLLDYSRQSELKLEPCRLEEIIGRACSLLRGELQENKVKVKRNIQPGLPSLVLDVHKIEQVLINLIKNAMESMQEGGVITLTAQQQGRFISLRVEDTGEGMSPDILKNIFNPFFTTKSEGFGLGLAISRTYVYDHGGNISVHSELGRGTTFDVLLPLPSQEDLRQAPSPEA